MLPSLLELHRLNSTELRVTVSIKIMSAEIEFLRTDKASREDPGESMVYAVLVELLLRESQEITIPIHFMIV